MNDKTTAYALNELTPAERAAFEEELKNNPGLRQQAADLKAFCSMLEKEIEQGLETRLMPEQRQTLMRDFMEGRKVLKPFWRRPLFLNAAGLAAAACLAVMLARQVMDEAPPVPEMMRDFKSTAKEHTPGNFKESAADSHQDGTLPTADQSEMAKNQQTHTAESSPRFQDDALKRDNSSGGSVTLFSNHPTANSEAELKMGAGSLAYTGANSYGGGTPRKETKVAAEQKPASEPEPKMQQPEGKSGSGKMLFTDPKRSKPEPTVSATTPAVPRAAPPPSAGIIQAAPERSAPVPAEEKAKSLLALRGGMASVSDREAADPSASNGILDAKSDTAGSPAEAARKLQSSAAKKTEDGVISERKPTSVGGGAASDAVLPKSVDKTNSVGRPGAPSAATSSAQPDHPASPLIAKAEKTKGMPGGFGLGKLGDENGDVLSADNFKSTIQKPSSTFSMHHYDATYDEIRRLLNTGKLPPPELVNTGALVNSIPYEDEKAEKDRQPGIHVDMAEAPWAPAHRIVRVTISSHAAAGLKSTVTFHAGAVTSWRPLFREENDDAKRTDAPQAAKLPDPQSLQTFTALYEFIPASPLPAAGGLGGIAKLPSDQREITGTRAGERGPHTLSVIVSWKEPTDDKPRSKTLSFIDDGKILSASEPTLRLAAGVASFALRLARLPEGSHVSWEEIRKLIGSVKPDAADERRAEFLQLIEKAERLEKLAQ